MKKNWPISANEITTATTFAPTNVRERKHEKSIIGARLRDSIAAKATSAVTDAANRARIRDEPHPQRCASITANVRPVSPMESAATPGTSTERSAVSSRE